MPDLTLRWLALKAVPLVISAQRMRAFLLAGPTAAICQPERSRSTHSQLEILSERRCAVSTAELAAWMSNVRRYVSPRLVILPSLALPPLECCLGVSPIQAPNCAPLLNCLKSPTVATTAEAVTGPTPRS